MPFAGCCAMNSYKINDCVIYGRSGVCRIEDIESRSFDGRSGDYYVLKPLGNKNATVYVPCDNEKLTKLMRPPLSKAEIDELLSGVGEYRTEWIDDKKERPIYFKNIIGGGDIKQILSLMRCIYLKKQELIAKNKSLPIADERLLSDTEKLINEEFAYALGIDCSEVSEYISQKVES